MRILRQRPKSSKVSRNVAHSRASRDGGMVLNDSFCVPPVRQSQGWSGWGSCRCGRPCTRPSGRAPWSLLPAGPTHRWSVETRQRSKCDDRNTRGRARVEVNETLWNKNITHPFTVGAAALVLMTLWSLNHTCLWENTEEKLFNYTNTLRWWMQTLERCQSNDVSACMERSWQRVKHFCSIYSLYVCSFFALSHSPQTVFTLL